MRPTDPSQPFHRPQPTHSHHGLPKRPFCNWTCALLRLRAAADRSPLSARLHLPSVMARLLLALACLWCVAADLSARVAEMEKKKVRRRSGMVWYGRAGAEWAGTSTCSSRVSIILGSQVDPIAIFWQKDPWATIGILYSLFQQAALFLWLPHRDSKRFQ